MITNAQGVSLGLKESHFLETSLVLPADTTPSDYGPRDQSSTTISECHPRCEELSIRAIEYALSKTNSSKTSDSAGKHELLEMDGRLQTVPENYYQCVSPSCIDTVSTLRDS
jgi:hypothetical protein